MQKIYFFVQLAFCFCTVFPKLSKGQDCNTLSATFTAYESRCAATGSISIRATGGSGSYKYKTIGPVNSNFTSSDSITGLSAGVYTVVINDLISNCTFTETNVVVPGSYQDPRFILTGINVSCDNGKNGIITVGGQKFGRSPFAYTIVAPSPIGVGTTNTTGVFTNLIGGDYQIQMTDSCGGIQTRSITINNYTWWIDSYSFNKISCDSATGFIKVIDSRGNVSTLGGIPGFMYGVVRSPGDTIWSSSPNFKLYVNGISAVDMIAKDGCGTIKKGSTSIKFSPSVGASVNISNKTCNSFSAALTGLSNFFGADFCLYDSKNFKLACNTTGIFNNIPYGTFCIRAHDLCLDTTISRCFTVSPPPISIGSNASIYNKTCSTFTAAIIGQTGLTNPTYCLFDSADVQIRCNTNGIFSTLAYGRYCIKTTDTCRNTTITRCFRVLKPRPIVPVAITPNYSNCRNITITVGGDSLFSPQYCLYDTAGILISCNTTGFFDSLTTGKQCVKVYDACYDTTINRCFTVGELVVANDLTATVSNKGCSTFTVKGSSNNLAGGAYCLYSSNDTLIGCNKTGTFNDLPYGTYCIKVKNDCPDTLFTRCFSVSPPVPSVKNTVTISNNTCTTFTASVTNQQNLNNPQFCIFDANNLLLGCNSTGVFSNLVYGSYCIKIKNTCYDTSIVRCFSANPKPATITVSTSKSCSYGYATFGISVTGGSLPVNIKIYKPDNSLFFDRNFNTNNINIDSIPGVVLGTMYKIIATDNCGSADTASIGATASIADHKPAVIAQCPSAAWLNGSGKIQLTTTTNMGLFTVRVIKKDGVTLSPQLSPNTASGGIFTFNDLGVGNYIISYKLNDICNRFMYDTVTIDPYVYPNLNRSSAYQCDISGFSVGAVASDGVGPFSYQIIGSSPAVPSITSIPQPNPVFNIDNGTKYSLVRLRALDACGNATLGDASILPLANYRITVDSNCFQYSSTLSVDTIYNSTYSWYKKENFNSTDSTYLGSGYQVYVPFLSASDTGTYICNVSVNSGCLKRSFVFNLSGLCYLVLPVNTITLKGKFANEKVQLTWKAEPVANIKSFIVERKTYSNFFTEIGRVNPKLNASGTLSYDFIDRQPEMNQNTYRLKLLYGTNAFGYSNPIIVNKEQKANRISCFPNPAQNSITISFDVPTRNLYKISLLNLFNQRLWETTFLTGNINTLQMSRPASLGKGMYILRFINMDTNESYTEKVIFL